jgi:hypothetical protein
MRALSIVFCLFILAPAVSAQSEHLLPGEIAVGALAGVQPGPYNAAPHLGLFVATGNGIELAFSLFRPAPQPGGRVIPGGTTETTDLSLRLPLKRSTGKSPFAASIAIGLQSATYSSAGVRGGAALAGVRLARHGRAAPATTTEMGVTLGARVPLFMGVDRDRLVYSLAFSGSVGYRPIESVLLTLSPGVMISSLGASGVAVAGVAVPLSRR